MSYLGSPTFWEQYHAAHDEWCDAVGEHGVCVHVDA